MSTRLHIVVPDGLLERIDAARGDVPRSKWFLRAAEARLDMSGEERFRQRIERKAPMPEESVPKPKVPSVSQTWRR